MSRQASLCRRCENPRHPDRAIRPILRRPTARWPRAFLPPTSTCARPGSATDRRSPLPQATWPAKRPPHCASAAARGFWRSYSRISHNARPAERHRSKRDRRAHLPSRSPSFITSWPSSTIPTMPLQGLARAVSPSSEKHSFRRSIWVSVSTRCCSNSSRSRSNRAAFAILGSALVNCFSACRMSLSSSISSSLMPSGVRRRRTFGPDRGGGPLHRLAVRPANS